MGGDGRGWAGGPGMTLPGSLRPSLPARGAGVGRRRYLVRGSRRGCRSAGARRASAASWGLPSGWVGARHADPQPLAAPLSGRFLPPAGAAGAAASAAVSPSLYPVGCGGGGLGSWGWIGEGGGGQGGGSGSLRWLRRCWAGSGSPHGEMPGAPAGSLCPCRRIRPSARLGYLVLSYLVLSCPVLSRPDPSRPVPSRWRAGAALAPRHAGRAPPLPAASRLETQGQSPFARLPWPRPAPASSPAPFCREPRPLCHTPALPVPWARPCHRLGHASPGAARLRAPDRPLRWVCD